MQSQMTREDIGWEDSLGGTYYFQRVCLGIYQSLEYMRVTSHRGAFEVIADETFDVDSG